MSEIPQLRKFKVLPDGEGRFTYLNRAATFDSDTNGNKRSEGSTVLDAAETSVNYQYSSKHHSPRKIQKPLKPSTDGKIPINKAGFVSYLLFTWLTPLVWKIFRNGDKQWSRDDVWGCSSLETVEVNSERLSTDWHRELKSKGPEKASMLRVWLWHIKKSLIVLTAAMTMNAVITFLLMGYIIELFIAYLESTDSSLAYGLLLVATVFVGQIIRAIVFTFLFFFGAQTGIRFRAGILGLAYRKLLKLKALKGEDQAKILTLFGADSTRVYMNCSTFVFLLSLPVYLTIVTVYLYYLIGPWCFISVGVFLFGYQLQAYITIQVAKLRKKTLVFTDRRLRFMKELVGSMKFIKMYALEDYFKKAIIGTRKQEQKYLLLSALVNSICTCVIPITPTLAAIATIAPYRAAGNPINPTTVFSTVATLNYLRTVVFMLPLASKAFGEAKSSFDRIKELLIQEEYEAPHSKCHDNSNAVEIQNAVFTWNSDTQGNNNDGKAAGDKLRDNSLPKASLQISHLFLNIQKGKLIGICGPVGCGKSSLITAMLGRMPIVSGHPAVSGSVAYAGQQAWIFNGTVRENILFGKPFDFAWYQEVVHVCGLEPDLAIMDNADETEIGERGINLSGGQKHRVSLARAVYSRSDIYLLDDPLSAVDIHVGKFLFHKCIQKTLKNKTVVLITHQLQYLNHCDEIFVMNDGDIVEQGQHCDLVSAGGYYSDMMAKFHFNDTSRQNVLESNEDTIKHRNGTKHGKSVEQTSTVYQTSLKDDNNMNSGLYVRSTAKVIYGREKLRKKEKQGKLISKEKTNVGNVSWSTYKSYISAAGGACLAILVLLSHVLASGSILFCTWWLGLWLSSMKSSQSTSHLNTTIESTTSVSFSTHLPSASNVTSFLADPSLSQQTEPAVWDVYLTVYTASIGGVVLLIVGKGIITSITTVSASVRMHNKALEKVIKAPMSFFDTNPSGRILNRFSKDLDEGDVYIPFVLDILLFYSSFTIISLIISSLSLPWIWIAIVPVACVFVLMKSVSSVSIRQMKRFENTARSPLLSHVSTSGQGLSTIVAFKQQPEFVSSCMKLADVTSTGLLLYESSTRWIGVRMDLVASMIVVVTCLSMVLAKGVINPALAALSLTFTSSSTTGVLQFLVRQMNETEARFTSMERIHEYEKYLDVESDDKVSIVPKENWPEDGHIFFSDVEMTYRDGLAPVLKQIRFEVFPREKIGIVGRTGAGKSSLAVALFRLVELSAGHIYVDGIDIACVPRITLRSKLSIIPQDPVLFAGTLRYNLDPKESFTDQELWSALEQAHVKEKVSVFNEGLQLFVEENGENFSVGERQLLCLARAILRRNKILILDEATASIDTATDALIQQTIRESFSDCTVLTVAHRLNTVLHCDRIVVMETGQIVETGKPQDLLADPHSVFNAMISTQAVQTQTSNGTES